MIALKRVVVNVLAIKTVSVAALCVFSHGLCNASFSLLSNYNKFLIAISVNKLAVVCQKHFVTRGNRC